MLSPLAGDWDKLDAPRKQKWRAIAQRYPTLSPAEQEKVRDNVRTWAELTPQQRQAAREQYKAMKQLPPSKSRKSANAGRSTPACPGEEARVCREGAARRARAELTRKKVRGGRAAARACRPRESAAGRGAAIHALSVA